MAELGDVNGPLQLPAREVREPDVVDLPCPRLVVEAAKRLLERGERVVGVDLIQVDAVDPEPAQAGVDRPGEVAAR